MASSTYRVSGFRRGTLRSQLVSFLNAAGLGDTDVVSASMHKDYMMRCYVIPQGDVITAENGVPAAESKPLVKLDDSASVSLLKSLRRRQPSQWPNEMYVL